MNEGWIKLHRQIVDNDLWFSERFSKAQAWMDLLLLANHKTKTAFLRGVEVSVDKGQLAYSIVSLSKRWQWNERTVDKYLKWLENKQMIQTKKTNVTTLITIVNYCKYQDNTEQSTEQYTERVQSRVQTNKNDKNEKKLLDKSNKVVNDQVEFVLKEFERVTGFRPTDKTPRRVAWNFVQRSKTEIKKFGREADDETFKRFTTKYFDWVAKQDWFDHCEKLETIKLKLVKYLDLFGGKNDSKYQGSPKQTAGLATAQAY